MALEPALADKVLPLEVADVVEDADGLHLAVHLLVLLHRVLVLRGHEDHEVELVPQQRFHQFDQLQKMDSVRELQTSPVQIILLLNTYLEVGAVHDQDMPDLFLEGCG